MADFVARRCFVSGRVQGVFYRASTRERARALGLSGYARNLEDGRVEVLIVGDPGAADQLIAWLHRGPSAARVDRVEVELVSLDALQERPTDFLTR